MTEKDHKAMDVKGQVKTYEVEDIILEVQGVGVGSSITRLELYYENLVTGTRINIIRLPLTTFFRESDTFETPNKNTKGVRLRNEHQILELKKAVERIIKDLK